MDEDNYGRYITGLSEPMTVESVVDAFGATLTADDYDVLYFAGDTTNGDTKDTLVDESYATAGAGTYPTKPGVYTIMVLKAGQEGIPALENGTTLASFDGKAYQTQSFTIKADSEDSLAGVFAFQQDKSTTTTAVEKELADRDFMYTGAELQIGFAKDGEMLDIDAANYKVDWTTSSSSLDAPELVSASNTYKVTDAGTYTATIYDNTTGSKATVEVVVDPIDLSKDVVAVPTVGSTGYTINDSLLANTSVTVNGEPLAAGAQIAVKAVQYDSATGTTYMPADGTGLGVYTFEAAPAAVEGGNTNVVGSTVQVTGCVVEKVVKFYYGTPDLADANLVSKALNGETFITAEKEAFDPDELSAKVGAYDGDDAEFTYTVTKDGQEVTSYTEPGEYVVTLDSKVEASETETFGHAGHEVATFTVQEKAPVSIDSWFVQVDGKAISSEFNYNGEAYVPTVVAFDAKGAKLTEGEDYTVAYRIASNDEAVESMVEADTYEIVLTPAGSTAEDSDLVQTFTISKAPIVVAKADRYVHAYTGEAVAPTFTGNTKADWTGLSLALSADNAVITYKKWDGTSYKAGVTAEADKTVENIDWTASTNKDVAAKDLKEVGVYQATIKVPASNKNFTDADDVATAVFEISKTAGFSDVAADAWYADSVYKAAELEYMKGIAEGIFAPENEMTRAEFAKLVFNMAGNTDKSGVEYPTQFTDVPANAWYAQAVEWAARYGIVNGTSETTFAPNETISREQIAAMFYRYAGNGAEADLSALDQFEDADQVSGWAKEAMGWAVENGYVNGVSDTALAPAETATRAQIAAIAVRVQPEAL